MKKLTLNLINLKSLLIFILLPAFSVANEKSFNASILFDHKVEYYYVKLMNPTPNFLCIDTHSLDTSYGAIFLTDKNGEMVTKNKINDAPKDEELGFNFLPAYLILRPGEERREAIDMRNFDLSEGTYNYSIIIGAYLCKDVADESRFKERRQIKGMAIQREGSIEVSKNFVQSNNIRAEQKTSNPVLPAHELIHKISK